MSVTSDGRKIVCNAKGCEAETENHVGLHSHVTEDVFSTNPLTGWLFVARGGEWRHYCPSCLVPLLAGLLDLPGLFD